MQTLINLLRPKRVNRRLPSVLENLDRIAANIVGGVPGYRSSIVWPKPFRDGFPLNVGVKTRKHFVFPSPLPPSYCQNLEDQETGRPRKRKKSRTMKRPARRTDIKLKAAKVTIKGGIPRGGNPHLRTVGDGKMPHEGDSLRNGKEWLTFPVLVIGNDRTFKGVSRKNSDSRGKKRKRSSKFNKVG